MGVAGRRTTSAGRGRGRRAGSAASRRGGARGAILAVVPSRSDQTAGGQARFRRHSLSRCKLLARQSPLISLRSFVASVTEARHRSPARSMRPSVAALLWGQHLRARGGFAQLRARGDECKVRRSVVCVRPVAIARPLTGGDGRVRAEGDFRGPSADGRAWIWEGLGGRGMRGGATVARRAAAGLARRGPSLCLRVASGAEAASVRRLNGGREAAEGRRVGASLSSLCPRALARAGVAARASGGWRGAGSDEGGTGAQRRLAGWRLRSRVGSPLPPCSHRRALDASPFSCPFPLLPRPSPSSAPRPATPYKPPPSVPPPPRSPARLCPPCLSSARPSSSSTPSSTSSPAPRPTPLPPRPA